MTDVNRRGLFGLIGGAAAATVPIRALATNPAASFSVHPDSIGAIASSRTLTAAELEAIKANWRAAFNQSVANSACSSPACFT